MDDDSNNEGDNTENDTNGPEPVSASQKAAIQAAMEQEDIVAASLRRFNAQQAQQKAKEEEAATPAASVAGEQVWWPAIDAALLKLAPQAQFDWNKVSKAVLNGIKKKVIQPAVAPTPVEEEVVTAGITPDACRLRFTALQKNRAASSATGTTAGSPAATATSSKQPNNAASSSSSLTSRILAANRLAASQQAGETASSATSAETSKHIKPLENLARGTDFDGGFAYRELVKVQESQLPAMNDDADDEGEENHQESPGKGKTSASLTQQETAAVPPPSAAPTAAPPLPPSQMKAAVGSDSLKASSDTEVDQNRRPQPSTAVDELD
jgi:hypothetical protein